MSFGTMMLVVMIVSIMGALIGGTFCWLFSREKKHRKEKDSTK